MFGKITRDSIARTYSNVKGHLHRGYHRAKHILGQVDHGIKVAKHVYSALAPAIDHFGGSGLHKHVTKAIGGYENVRNKVMDVHDTAGHHVNQVVGNLKKAVPSIGL